MGNTVNNQALKDTLELLAKKTFALYNKAVHRYPQTPNADDILIIIDDLNNSVRRFKEFERCKGLLHADVTASSLFGKLVGTILGGSKIEDAESCISEFLEQLYLRSKDQIFDLSAFHELYEAFEELFYADRMRFRDIVRLYNFESEAEEIVLEEGLSIKKLPQVQGWETVFHESTYRPYARFSKSDFVIESRYTMQKITRDRPLVPTAEQIRKESNESEQFFTQVMKALRMLKSSAVYRENRIETQQLTFDPSAEKSSRVSLLENPVVGEKCIISVREADAFKVLYKRVKQETSQPFNIASNRLVYGMERRTYEDRLLDYMIGLESLYLPDGHDELTFRLSLRVAFLLHQEREKREESFQFMKKMYGVRSKIAHGKVYNLTREDISKIEEILRRSLKIYLENPNKFKKDFLDRIYFQE